MNTLGTGVSDVAGVGAVQGACDDCKVGLDRERFLADRRVAVSRLELFEGGPPVCIGQPCLKESQLVVRVCWVEDNVHGVGEAVGQQRAFQVGVDSTLGV